MIDNLPYKKSFNDIIGQITLAICIAIFFAYMFFPELPLYKPNNFSTYLSSILGAYDQQFLKNDFFVEANKGFGPRFYYAKIVSLFIDLDNVNLGLLSFHTIEKILLCISTLFLILTLFPASPGLIVLTLFAIFLIPGPTIGGHGMFTQKGGIMPMNLAIPFVIFGLAYLIKKQPIKTAVLCVLSSLFHPNIGIFYGIIFLIFGLALSYFTKEKNEDYSLAKRHIFAIILLIICITPMYIIPLLLESKIISSYNIVKILAFIRAPHHLLLSKTSVKDILDIIYFLISGVCFIFLYRKLYKGDSFSFYIILLFFLSTPIIFLLGYYLIEIEYSKIGVILYPSRFMELFRYIGLIFFSGVTVLLVKSKNTFLTGLCIIIAISHSYKLLAIITVLVTLILFYNIKRQSKVSNCQNLFMVVTLFSYFLLFESQWADILYLFSFFSFAVILYVLPKNSTIPILATFISITILTIGIITKGNFFFDNYKNTWFRKRPLSKHVNYNNFQSSIGKLAITVRKKTEPNSLFIVPPKYGYFRILANRAVLVDFKSMPFQNYAIAEWYNRMKDVFGPLKGGGWDLQKNTIKSYRKINDKHLKFLKGKYNIDYAVLYKETKTNFPVIATISRLKVVKIEI